MNAKIIEILCACKLIILSIEELLTRKKYLVFKIYKYLFKN